MFGSSASAKRKSAWTFKTSGTGGLGLEFVAVSTGTEVLIDPSGAEQRFHFRAAGVGLSWGIRKIPKIGKIDPGRLDPKGLSDHGSANVAPEAFWNHGSVYVMDGCPNDELVKDDFTGMCLTVDVGGGLIVGYSGAAMMVGVDATSLAIGAAMHASPLTSMFAPPIKCKGMILSRGWNVGAQASVGFTEQLGYMWS